MLYNRSGMQLCSVRYVLLLTLLLITAAFNQKIKDFTNNIFSIFDSSNIEFLL